LHTHNYKDQEKTITKIMTTKISISFEDLDGTIDVEIGKPGAFL
jgi:polyisoprenoid-binding protein YceI